MVIGVVRRNEFRKRKEGSKPMQYKQLPRILVEIIESPKVSMKITLSIGRLFLYERFFPKLGPYKKRSRPQVLWRMASNSRLAGKTRWDALVELLKLHQEAKKATSATPSTRPDVRTDPDGEVKAIAL